MAKVRTIQDVIEEFGCEPSAVVRGTRFEELMAGYFAADATLAATYDEVFRWPEWSHNEGTHDTGIDLVARERESGEGTAIQRKVYDPRHRLQKADIDSFFTASGKRWDGVAFTNRIIISTTDRWSRHAEDALTHQTIPVASFAWWRGFCSAPWRSCCRDHAGLAAGRCRGLNREGCARSGPFGSLPLRQSPKAPPLTRITMPRPMRTMGKRMRSQRSSTSAIGGRVATNFARATRTATSARKTMQ